MEFVNVSDSLNFQLEGLEMRLQRKKTQAVESKIIGDVKICKIASNSITFNTVDF